MSESIKKVVVTGGSGKAGVATIEHLVEHGYVARSVDIAPLNESVGKVDALTADLTDYGQTVEALQGFDAVVHLAAIPAPGKLTEARTFDINVNSTFNVFQAAVSLGMKRVVWASSETVLGLPFESVKPKIAPIDESHAPYPESSYSLSKVVGEEMAKQFSRRSGLPFVGLRFSNIILPNDYERFEGFQEDPFKRKWNLWGYVDTRDVGMSCRLALEAELAGAEAFIIAAGDTVMRRKNRDLLAAVFPGCSLKEGTGDNETLLSIDKARRMLGYEPKHSWRDVVE